MPICKKCKKGFDFEFTICPNCNFDQTKKLLPWKKISVATLLIVVFLLTLQFFKTTTVTIMIEGKPVEGFELSNFFEIAKTDENGQVTFPSGEARYSIYLDLGNDEKIYYNLSSTEDAVYNISYKNQYIIEIKKKYGIFTEKRLTSFNAYRKALRALKAQPKQ